VRLVLILCFLQLLLLVAGRVDLMLEMAALAVLAAVEVGVLILVELEHQGKVVLAVMAHF
jgi:hypothetical protein